MLTIKRDVIIVCTDRRADWSCRLGNLIQPIRSTTQIWVVTRHQYGILHSFLRRHFAGKPVVASQMSAFSLATVLLSNYCAMKFFILREKKYA